MSPGTELSAFINPPNVVEITSDLDSLRNHTDLQAIASEVIKNPRKPLAFPLGVNALGETINTAWQYTPARAGDQLQIQEVLIAIKTANQSPETLRTLRITAKKDSAGNWLITEMYMNQQAPQDKFVRGARWLWGAVDEAVTQALSNHLKAPVTREFVVSNPKTEIIPMSLGGFRKEKGSLDKPIWTKTYFPEDSIESGTGPSK